jgi:alpha-amylase
MVSICFYFQVHQPFRLKKFSVFDIGHSNNYFDDTSGDRLDNKKILRKVAQKCYIPTNNALLYLIRRYPQFKVSFSISGVALEQFEKYAPEVLKSFQELVSTGNVEILEETYYHSLAFLYSKHEFREQVNLHKQKIKELFGVEPKVFRNTELIYNDSLAKEIESLGYKGIIAEGADHILGWRSPNFLYSPSGTSNIKLLLKNYKLSDDIAFRFSNRGWEEWPLTAPKFAQWVNSVNGNGNVINLFMDYETFGEHQWSDTGIFEFLKSLPEEILKHPDNDFKTPSEVIENYNVVSKLSVPHYVSWADIERDLSAWSSNVMQKSALNEVFNLEHSVKKTKDEELINIWRRLLTSDHFYYMCTKWFADGDVHKYFNPYESPYDAYITFMNIINDIKIKIDYKTNIYKQGKGKDNIKKRTTNMTSQPNQEKCFWLNDGRTISDMQELYQALKDMSSETFTHHVTDDKNDFSSWIKHVFKDEKLSQKLHSLKDKNKMALAIRSRLGVLKREKIMGKLDSLPEPNKIQSIKTDKKSIINNLKTIANG